MMEPKIGAIPRDARLLVLFDEIYRTQSLTRAAARLDLSQPTASIWLAKLRRDWHDPLFVRTSTGMQPTPRADELIAPVREALALLRRLSGDAQEFDPKSACRNFRICMTDASHVTMLPRLLAHVRAASSDVRLDASPISAATARMLEAGDADLALGFVPGLEAGFHAQQLYTQDFICLVNAKHPRIAATFTARAYREEAHIGILSSASYPMLQNALKRQHVNRRVQLELPGFLGVTAIVSSTDLIATVPRTIGEELARSGSVRIFPCPVKVPSFPVKQYWHTRYHNDPGIRWLRGVCAGLFVRASSAQDPSKAAKLRNGSS